MNLFCASERSNLFFIERVKKVHDFLCDVCKCKIQWIAV